MQCQEALPAVDPVAQAKAQASASRMVEFLRGFWNEKQSQPKYCLEWENEGK